MKQLSFVSLIFFGVLTGLLGLIKAYEVNTVGLSAMTKVLGIENTQRMFDLIIHLPVEISISVFLVNASYICFVARSNGAPLAHIFGTSALFLGYLNFALEVIEQITFNDQPIAFHSTLYLSNDFFRGIGFVFTILGVAGMICHDRVYKIGAYAVGFMTGLSFVLYAYLYLAVDTFAAEIFLVVPCIGLMALYFIRILDEEKEDMPHFTVGVALLVVSSFGIEIFGSVGLPNAAAETDYTMHARDLAQNCFLVMTFFGALMVHKHPQISVGLQWMHSMLMAIGLFLTFVPALVEASDASRHAVLNVKNGYDPMSYMTMAGILLTVVTILAGLYAVFFTDPDDTPNAIMSN